MAENNNNTCSTPAQILCAKGCGFFGSASTMNMCSKCFREHENKASSSSSPTSAAASASSPTAAAAAATAAASPALVAVETAAAAPSAVAATPAGAPAALSPALAPVPAPLAPMAARVDSPVVVKEKEVAGSAAVQEETPAGPPPRKIQKNHGRCWECRRKVGLLGFRCKCDYTFCGEHRYSDKHNCTFDFKTEGQAQLEKDNPVVVADKMDRI